MSDLVFHYQNILKVKHSKKLYYENFPKTISRADFEKLEWVYEDLVKDDQVMSEIEDIIEYAIPKFDKTINEGKEIYEFVEGQIEISPVGIHSLYTNEGYFLLNTDSTSDINIYRYQITVFEGADDTYRGINTTYVAKEAKSPFVAIEEIKRRLVKTQLQFSNPATYLIESKLDFPIIETLLPVAKRMLVRYISSA